MPDVERWAWVPGYEGEYEASDQGRVRSWRPYPHQNPAPTAPRILKTNGGQRYRTVVLAGSRGRRTWAVHQVVAMTFLGPCPEGREIRHLNGQSHDCRLVNLTYGTHRENVADTRRHGTAWYLDQNKIAARSIVWRRNWAAKSADRKVAVDA